MRQIIHQRSNSAMIVALICMLYALIVVEWNYYEEKSLYGLFILSIGFVLGLFSGFNKSSKSQPPIYKTVIIYGLLLIVSIIFSPVDINPIQDIIRNTTWVVMFCMCYKWGYKNYDFSSAIRIINYIVLPILYIIYLYILVKTFFVGVDHGFRDAIIPIAVLTPFVLLNKKSRIRNIQIVIISFLTLLSAKRSIILGVVMGLLVYFFMTYKDSRNKLKILILLSVVFLVVICLYTFGYLNLEIFDIAIYRFDEMLNGDSNGRDAIAEIVLKDYNNSDFLLQLFGHGSHTTVNIVGKLAHNDFLQVLYDYGLIPLIFFVIIYIQLIIIGLKAFFTYTFARKDCAVYCYTLISFIFFGMFNCYISSPQTFTLSMVIFGYLIGQFQFNKNYLKKNGETSL